MTDKSYYDFFLGNFEKIYINKFNDEVAMEDEILYLMMLYLSDTKVMTRIKDKILCYLTRNFDEYNYRNLNIDINNKSLSLLEKLDNWKQNIQINEELKNQFINKLELITERKITYILENKYRNRYSEAAIFVVMLDEVLTNNKYINKDEYISKIDKKYVRFNLFRKKIKNYKEIK